MFSYKHNVILYSHGMTTKIRKLTLILSTPYCLIHRTHIISPVASMIFFVAKGFNLGPCVIFSPHVPLVSLNLEQFHQSFLDFNKLEGSYLLNDKLISVPCTCNICILYLCFIFVLLFLVFIFTAYVLGLLHLYLYLYLVFVQLFFDTALIKSDTYQYRNILRLYIQPLPPSLRTPTNISVDL